MILTLSPVRADPALRLHRAGDVLTVNGAAYDLGTIPEGGERSAEEIGCPWIAGTVTRLQGVLHVTLLLPHGADAPPETLFPVPVTPDADGDVTLPPHDAPPADREAEQGPDREPA